MMPLWVKTAHTLFLCILIPVYWRHYGPANFLWFSDIALFLLAVGLWLENPWPVSVAAVSVLLLEVLWNIDYFTRLFTGARFIGLSNYMFDHSRPIYLRALSLFHVYMPPLMVWMLYQQGYEPRAWLVQTAICWLVLPLTYWLSPQENINWIRGFGDNTQKWMAPGLYLVVLMTLFPLLIYLPTHFVLRWIFLQR